MSYGDSARLHNESYFDGFSEITPSKINNIKDTIKTVVEKIHGNDDRRQSAGDISQEIKQNFCESTNSNSNAQFASCSNAKNNETVTKENGTKTNLFHQSPQQIH